MAKGKYEKWLESNNLILLEGWARDGLTDEQIAHNMGIRTSTLYEWKKKYLEISESLKRGKEVVDILVENALLKKALGYTVKEQKVTKDGLIVEIEKEISPDTTAQIFWLKNRKPDKWRDRVENINTNDDDKIININICSTKGKTI
ncbi:MAG: transposase [Anaerotignaceae bacterium]